MFFGFCFQNSDLDFMGGLYGQVINNWLIGVFGQIGTGFFIFFFGITSVILLFNPSLSWIVDFFNKITKKFFEKKIDENGFTNISSNVESSNTENDGTNNINPTDSVELSTNVDNAEPEEKDNSELEIELPKNESVPSIDKEKGNEEGDVDLAVQVGASETELSKKDIDRKLKEFGEYDPKLDLSDYKRSKELNNKLLDFCDKFCAKGQKLKIEIDKLSKQ